MSFMNPSNSFGRPLWKFWAIIKLNGIIITNSLLTIRGIQIRLKWLLGRSQITLRRIGRESASSHFGEWGGM